MVFLFYSDQFIQWTNSSSFWIALSSDRWHKISLKIMNSLLYESHKVNIDSANQFADNSTTSPPNNTASYTLVSKIDLELQRKMSYLYSLWFLWAAVAIWYPSSPGRTTSIPTYSYHSSGVWASSWSGIYSTDSTGFTSRNSASSHGIILPQTFWYRFLLWGHQYLSWLTRTDILELLLDFFPCLLLI